MYVNYLNIYFAYKFNDNVLDAVIVLLPSSHILCLYLSVFLSFPDSGSLFPTQFNTFFSISFTMGSENQVRDEPNGHNAGTIRSNDIARNHNFQ